MKVVVINGSPRGKYSLTLQSFRYIEATYGLADAQVFHIAQLLPTLERDMHSVVDAIAECDLIIISYPVYTCLAPAQLHRFFELLEGTGVDFCGKVLTQITTSKHFYDNNAHRYVEQRAADLGMHYLRGLSQDMADLPTPDGQRTLCGWWEYTMHCLSSGMFEVPAICPTPRPQTEYRSSATEAAHTLPYRVAIITNARAEDTNLLAMIQDFQRTTACETFVFNVEEYAFRGGCLGCLRCTGSGHCVYRDGFEQTLRDTIQTADARVFAIAVRHHDMGYKMKLFDDRNFCNGHRTVNMHAPVGYIVQGDLLAEPNLLSVIEGRAELGQNLLCHIVTDRATDIAAELRSMNDKLCYALEKRLSLPANFLGVGGMKIFRDLIFVMRGIMPEDHRFYKKAGFYRDIPTRQRSTMIKMKLVGKMMNNDKLRAKMGNMINEGMMLPYRKTYEPNAKIDLPKKPRS